MKVGMGPVVPNLFKDNVNGVFRRARYLGTELGSPRRPDQGPVTRRLTQLAVQALPDLHERVKRRNVRSTLAPKGALVISLRRVTDARRGDAATVCRVRVAFWFPGRVANPGRQLMLLAPNDSLWRKMGQFGQLPAPRPNAGYVIGKETVAGPPGHAKNRAQGRKRSHAARYGSSYPSWRAICCKCTYTGAASTLEKTGMPFYEKGESASITKRPAPAFRCW